MKTRIFYEDHDILVVGKPAGLAVQSGRVGEVDMVSELKNYLASSAREGVVPYLGLVHRLDQPVAGLLVVAKTPQAAGTLSGQKMEKEYRALCYLAPEQPDAGTDRCGSGSSLPGQFSPGSSTHRSMGEEYRALSLRKGRLPRVGEEPVVLTAYLCRDPKTNTSRVVSGDTPGAQKAVLRLWEVVPQPDGCGFVQTKEMGRPGEAARMEGMQAGADGSVLLAVVLETGRHHQIRVQLSAAGMPILGDQKYATAESRAYAARLGLTSLCLCAYRLAFRHPVTGKRMEYQMEALPWEG